MWGPVLPEVEYIRFEDPPLRAMLGQVAFPPILKLQKGVAEIADFQDSIRETFPEFEVQKQVQVQISPGDGPQATSTSVSAYRFATEGETWSALLSPNSLTIEAAAGGKYRSFDEFVRHFSTVWTEVVRHFSPAEVRQQGLRYVDHLEGNRTPQQWSDWINPSLLGPLVEDALATGLKQSLSEYVYPEDDGRLIFKHGIRAAGPENALGYLLDFDSVHTATADASDVDGLIARFKQSHEILYRFFRWCVTEKAIGEFRASDA